MAFQIACEAARSRPGAKVCVIDFSLYSDLSALLLGGSARGGIGKAMKGLQTCLDVTSKETRAEGLVRALETAASVRQEGGTRRSTNSQKGEIKKGRRSVFGSWFSRGGGAGANDEDLIDVDLTRFMMRPHDVNKEVPKNLYLVAGCGTESWGKDETAMTDEDENMDVPLWARTGHEWIGAAEVFRDAVRALPKEFDAIFIDTDHLAACVLSKLAFAAMDSIVIPLSYNDMDFNRLFSDITENALFTDVLIGMDQIEQLQARVKKFMFTRVGSNANSPSVSEGGISSPFTPTKTSSAQMDDMARQIWSACEEPVYKSLLLNTDSLDNVDGNAVRSFMQHYFGMFKAVPELASLISTMNGIPVCVMTSQTYTAANGLSGSTGVAALNSLKAELSASTQLLLDERYNAPIESS